MAIESDQLQIQPLPIHKRQGMLPGPGAPPKFKIWSRDLWQIVLCEVEKYLSSLGYGAQLYLYYEYI
jgi:hypothetical protein